MADIKMTLEDGTVIEGSAEDISELSTLLDNKEEGDVGNTEKTETRQAKVGDTIKITDNSRSSMRNMTVGRPYEVVAADTGNIYVNVIDDVGEEASAHFSGYKVEVEDADGTGDEGESPKLTIEDILGIDEEDSSRPEFSEGDVVELMYGGEGAEMLGISSGDRLKVIAKTGGVLNYEVKSLTNETTGYVNGSKLRLIESKSSDSQKIKVGDKENEVPLFNLFNGKTYQVESVESDGMYWIYDGSVFSGATPFGGGYASRDQLVLVDDRRGKEVVEVGDIAKVTENSYGFPVGSIGEVVQVDNSDATVLMEAVDTTDGKKGVFYEKNVKLVAREGDRYDR